MSYGLKDAKLSVTGDLPGASATAALGIIDLEHSEDGDHVAGCELLVEAPALTTAELPDTETLTVEIEHGDESDLSDAVDLVTGVPLATGAGGAGADAGSARVALPSSVKRYVRVSIANSGAGDPSAKEASASFVF